MFVCARVEAETDAICRRCAFQHGKPRWTACWRRPVPSDPRICICHGMSKNSGTRNHPKPSKNLSVSEVKSTVRVCWTADRAVINVIRHSATWRASCLSFGDLGAPGVHDLDAQNPQLMIFWNLPIINHSSIIHQSFIERAHDVVVFVQEYDSCKSIQIQHHPRDSDHFQSFSYLW